MGWGWLEGKLFLHLAEISKKKKNDGVGVGGLGVRLRQARQCGAVSKGKIRL